MFKRLTHRSKYGIAYTKIAVNESNMVDVGECYTGRIIDCLAAYQDTGLSPEEVQKLKKSDASKEQCTIDQHGEIHRLRDELKRYKQAEQEGRLVVLPCKIGEKVYRYCNDAINEGTIINILLNVKTGEIGLEYEMPTCYTCSRSGTLGKNLFLTREAAEKALGGVNEDAR